MTGFVTQSNHSEKPYPIVRPRRWSRDEYYKMAECGIFGPEEHWELIDGVIIERIGSFSRGYYGCVHLTRKALHAIYRNDYYVSSRSPLILNNFTEPEPDIVVALGNVLNYSAQHPTANDTCLVVEIDDGRLARDYDFRAALYAEASIPEYWIVNLLERQLVVYRTPVNELGYQSVITATQEENVSSLFAPELTIAISQLFSG
ncbi:MAG: Uma2 family endonuclease [Capsulimonas sp.]|uniref:Uma2 family endonuclease n=1 Tax=Capsulimonas sp. TaxID=2494211 RepID=UPI00326762CB